MSHAIAALDQDPRPRGVVTLAGSPLWCIRVGSVRVLYAISDRERLVIIDSVKRRNERTYDL